MKCKDCSDTLCKFRTCDAEKVCVYDVQPQEKILLGGKTYTPIDWESIRIQAAISAMNGILSNSELSEASLYTLNAKRVVKESINVADELISEFQKVKET